MRKRKYRKKRRGRGKPHIRKNQGLFWGKKAIFKKKLSLFWGG